jgi:hypothetical protein
MRVDKHDFRKSAIELFNSEIGRGGRHPASGDAEALGRLVTGLAMR